MGDLTGINGNGYAFFSSTGNISGKISNITMGDVSNIAFYGAIGSISGTITDVIMGNVTGDAFYAGGTMSGKIIDIIMGDVENAFVAGNISGTISNVTTGDVTDKAFHSLNNITGKISYVRSNGIISTDPPGTFTGELINCELDCRDKGFTVINNLGNGAIIERCKLLNDNGYYAIYSTLGATAKILYTISNHGITQPGITNTISPNYNIDDPNVI